MNGDGQKEQLTRSGRMIAVDRALIRYTWAPGTRQIGKVWVVELQSDSKPSMRNAFQKPRFIREEDRTQEPVFDRGACEPAWMEGDAWQTPAGVFGDMLLSEGFASWHYIREALLAFTSIQGCDWAMQMLGTFHPDIFDRDCDPSVGSSTLGSDLA